MSQEPALKNRSQERRKNTPEDFMFGKLIGEGSFSHVFLVREVSGNRRELACKVCDKKQIQKENKTKYILSEKVTTILSSITSRLLYIIRIRPKSYKRITNYILP